jgi:hypothetical protein
MCWIFVHHFTKRASRVSVSRGTVVLISIDVNGFRVCHQVQQLSQTLATNTVLFLKLARSLVSFHLPKRQCSLVSFKINFSLMLIRSIWKKQKMLSS